MNSILLSLPLIVTRKQIVLSGRSYSPTLIGKKMSLKGLLHSVMGHRVLQ